MIQLLKYFFFKIYSFSLSKGQNDPGWAMTIVSLFVLVNVYSLFDIILILTHTKLPQISTTILLFSCGLLLYINYTLLMKDGKAQLILKDFQQGQTRKGILNLCLALYIIFTIILFIYTGNMVRAFNAN